MSIAPAVPPSLAEARPEGLPDRRIRHQARDAATLMAFSAATSVGVAVCCLLLAALARQA